MLSRTKPYMLRVFNYRFYLGEFAILLFTYLLSEGIFGWLIVPNSGIKQVYDKLLSLVIYGFLIYNFKKLQKDERIYIIVFSFLIIKLVFESLYLYGNYFNQFTLYTVIYPVVYVVFVKYVCRSLDFDLLEFLAKFYLFTYIVFMLIYGRGFSFSLEQVEMDDYGPFSGDSRIIHARSIFMMIIPLLWYLSKFIQTKKIVDLLVFFLCFSIILIHQHRSVWSSAIFAAMLFIGLTIKENKKTASRFYNVMLISLTILALSVFYVSNLYPGFIDFMGDRFSEIFNPSKEGSTGNFRIEQTEIYGEFIKQRPILGWSFEGFSVRNPLVDWWDENTGQHFHEGFIEILFYHGIVGLILKYSSLAIILIKVFTKKLSQEAIIMVSFCLSGLLFSLSYVLPLIFWGHVGLCLYYLERKNTAYDLHSYTSI
jgi:hypothetical protein